MKNKKVSIIILTWNRLSDLKLVMPNWLAQDYDNIEYVVVDNGSSDGTIEYLEQLKIENCKLKIILNGKNLGISVGKNIGVKNATGDYVFMVDNDIKANTTTLISELVKYYESIDNPGFVNVLLLDKEHVIDGLTRWYGTYYRWYGLNRNKQILIDELLRLDLPVRTAVCFGGNMFVSRELMLDLGLFDESQIFNIDDDDISTRAAVWGYKNYLYTKDYLLHLGFHTNQSNETYALRFASYFSGKARPIIKNFQWTTIIWLFPLFCWFTLILTIKHCIYRKYPAILFALIKSVGIFIKNLPTALVERKRIQAKRKVNDSDFFKVHPPIKGI